MPFVDYSTEDELKKKQEQGQAAAPTTMQSTAIQSGQQTAGGAMAGTGKGSGWTNVQTYLGNNAGQGAQTTQNVLDVKQNQIKDAVSGLNKEVDDTKTKVGQSTVQRNTALENQVKTNPTAVDKNAYNAYTQQTYGGPSVYTPSVDVEKKWNNLPTQTSLQQVADPKTIGQQLKKSDYTYGLGKLDSYLMNSEGAGNVDRYNQANKNVMNDRQAAVGGVNSAIEQARKDSAANVQALRDTTSQSYKDTLARAQATKGQAESAAYDKAYADVQKRFTDAGVDGPAGIAGYNTYIRPNQEFSWQDSVDDVTLQALNTLADIDGDDTTNMINKGNREALNVDWAALDAYINAAKPAAVNTASSTDFKTDGVVYDQYGNRTDDGLTAEELYKRLNGAK
jgi:hypothetical protein